MLQRVFIYNFIFKNRPNVCLIYMQNLKKIRVRKHMKKNVKTKIFANFELGQGGASYPMLVLNPAVDKVHLLL